MRLVVCPGCHGPAQMDPSNRFRPFCSVRCKGTDFGQWASEAFRLAAAPQFEDELPEESPEDSGGRVGR